jgi:hypothetical protein
MADMGGFDADQVEPLKDFDTLPAGDYLAMATESELKPTKDGNGTYLAFTFEILDGEFKGRKIWANITRSNQNRKAVEIGNAALSSLCRAVKVMRPKESFELHNLPLVIKVKVRKDKQSDELRNDIKGFEDKSTFGQAKKPAAGGTGPKPGGAPAGDAPWKR